MSRHRCTITRTQASCRRGVVIGQTLRTVGGIHLGQRRRGIAIDSRGEAAGPRCVVAKGEGRWMTGVIHVQDKAFFHYGVEVCVCWTVVSLTLLRIFASSRLAILALALIWLSLRCDGSSPMSSSSPQTGTYIWPLNFLLGSICTVIPRLNIHAMNLQSCLRLLLACHE
jgi:hypothetical protein